MLLAHREARALFSGLKRVILDELHALVTSKRGDLLALGLARLYRLAPGLTAIGLSATVREPDELRRYLAARRPNSSPCMRGEGLAPSGARQAERQRREGEGASPDEAPPDAPPHPDGSRHLDLSPHSGERWAPHAGVALADLVVAAGGARPDIRMLDLDAPLPLAGHTAALAMPAIYDLIRRHKTTLVFVNTRLQAEFVFRELWDLNDDGLAIALHHGSLDVAQRRRVEAAMAEGRLRGVVCTSTLDLGIDWGDVDLVVNVGAPKGASRIMQRIGRANHRLDEPSKAYLVPANRFEILECRAALDAVHEAAQDTPDARIGALDVLAQHVLGMACAEPFAVSDLYEEVRSAAPYAGLSYEDFEAVVDFVATGGYALRAYERFAKIVRGTDGLWRVRDGRVAQQYRLNVGTIVEATMIKVRLARTTRARPGAVLPRGGKTLGEIEEYFAETMTPGDTFLFAGEVLRFEGIVGDEALVTRTAPSAEPKIPSYAGGKFPLSSFLAERVRTILADPFEWDRLPPQVSDWLLWQRRRSVVPGPRDLLVETFPRGGRHYLVCYPFEGRLAHQTLGMLLTRRLERARLRPFGFVANDYGLAVWGLGDASERGARQPGFLDDLFSEDMLGDDLEDLARRVGADEAHLPLLRHHRRADRAPLSGSGENPAAGHDVDRSRLRRAAQARAGSRAVARRARRCGNGTPRRAASGRDAASHPGANHPQGARPGVAAGRLRHARNRPRTDRGRGRGRGAGGGGSSVARRGPGVTALPKLKNPTTEIGLAGMAATLDLSGALFLASEDALVVADLHLEKGSSFAKQGQMLPPYDTRETLRALAEALDRFAPRTVIALGDSFHDLGGPDRLADDDRAALAALQGGRQWMWITGNHDRALPEHIGGEALGELTLGSLTLRHEPVAGATDEIAGHLHPVGKVVMRGRAVRRRCFVTDGRRCILPAFGAYAGGLNACDAAFKPLFPNGFTAHLIGDGRLFAIGRAMLCRD